MRGMSVALSGNLPPPAPGEAERVALALANTRLEPTDGPLDLIADPGAAGAWLAARRLTAGPAALEPADAERISTLRESVRALFTALVHGREPAGADLGALNDALAAAPCVSALAWPTDGPRLTQNRAAPDPLAPVLAALAFDAAQLLCGPEAGELAQCGAHACTRFFLRTHASRQVCSTRCGDRVRAARHYARRRASRA